MAVKCQVLDKGRHGKSGTISERHNLKNAVHKIEKDVLKAILEQKNTSAGAPHMLRLQNCVRMDRVTK